MVAVFSLFLSFARLSFLPAFIGREREVSFFHISPPFLAALTNRGVCNVA